MALQVPTCCAQSHSKASKACAGAASQNPSSSAGSLLRSKVHMFVSRMCARRDAFGNDCEAAPARARPHLGGGRIRYLAVSMLQPCGG